MGAPKRTIIIPKGTLNTDEVNVVVIPRSLKNTKQPLIVRPTKGKNLAVKSLPVWGDELDAPAGKSKHCAESCEDDSTEESDPEDEGFNPTFESTRICSPGTENNPKILHMSSKTVVITGDGPPEAVEVTFDAPEGGVDPKILEAVMTPGKEPSCGSSGATSQQRQVTRTPQRAATGAGTTYARRPNPQQPGATNARQPNATYARQPNATYARQPNATYVRQPAATYVRESSPGAFSEMSSAEYNPTPNCVPCFPGNMGNPELCPEPCPMHMGIPFGDPNPHTFSAGPSAQQPRPGGGCQGQCAAQRPY